VANPPASLSAWKKDAAVAAVFLSLGGPTVLQPWPVLAATATAEVSSKEGAPKGLSASLAVANQEYEAKRAANEAKLATLAANIKGFKEQRATALKEQSLAEKQSRDVERTLNDKQTDAARKRLLDSELSSIIKPAIKRQSGIAAIAEANIKRSEKESSEIKQREVNDVKTFKDRIKRENKRAAQEAKASFGAEKRTLVEAEKRLKSDKEKLQQIQSSIKTDISLDNELIKKIEKLEREAVNVRRTEQKIVSSVEQKTVSASALIDAIGQAEASLKAQQVKTAEAGKASARAKSLVRN
jgi:chromosome segregation ATPase